jgi:predicted nucleic acid-binding protein
MTEIAVAVGQSLPECSLAWMLRSEHPDLEDNLIMAAAETSNVDFVVTYDKDMLEHFSPACITPAQALRLLELHHHVEV